MIRLPIFGWSRITLFAAAAAILLGGLVYSRALRLVAVPGQMRYVPKENGALVGIGDLHGLLRAVDAHFGDVLRQKQGDFSADQMQKAVEAWGVDPTRGILLTLGSIFASDSIHLGKNQIKDKEFLAVVPIKDQKVFLKSVAEQLGGTPKQSRIGSAANGFNDFEFESMQVVVPEDRIALVSNSRAMLERALLNQDANLYHARDDDALYSGIHRYLRGPMLSGPAILISQAQDPSILRRADTVLSLSGDAVDATVYSELVNRQITVVDSVFQPAPPPVEWARLLPHDTAAALALQDSALPRYLNFLANFADIRQSMQNLFAGILWRLRTVQQLRRAVVAATTYRDGLPDLLLGLWGNTSDLDALFRKMQAEFRQRSPQTSATGTGDERVYNGTTIRFLTPQLTADEIQRRPELEGVPADVLRGDRYRMAFASAGGVFWVATEVHDLEQLLDRIRTGGDSLSQNPAFQTVRSEWHGAEKLQFYANLDRAIALGLLSPESRVEDWVKNNLLVLSGHPAISMELDCPGRNLIRVHARLRKRQTTP